MHQHCRELNCNGSVLEISMDCVHQTLSLINTDPHFSCSTYLNQSVCAPKIDRAKLAGDDACGLEEEEDTAFK